MEAVMQQNAAGGLARAFRHGCASRINEVDVQAGLTKLE
jgi:hypothetical protein